MLTADVRFEGWTTADWQRFLGLWKPRATRELPESTPRGGLFVIHDGVHVRKMLHSVTGRLAPDATWADATLRGLEGLAEAHGAAWVVAAHLGALDEVMERFGARARRSDDMTTQALSLVGIVREMMSEGAIERWPKRLEGIPLPTPGMVDRALDTVCPSGKAIALGMFQDGALWTAFVARRRGTGFDVIAGPDELRPAMGVLSGDWRRDYGHLVRAVEARYAPLALGCFGEVSTLRDLQVDAKPGAWGRAALMRELVVSPIPAGVGLALGFDGARYALEAAKVITSRVDPFGLLEPALRAVRKRLGAATGDKDIEHVLGFDPIAALRALLRR